MFINKDILSSVQSFTENRLFIYGDLYMKNSLAYGIRVWLALPQYIRFIHCDTFYDLPLVEQTIEN